MLFLRKKTAPTTSTVEIATETKIKETPSKSDTIIEVVKATIHYLRLLITIKKLIKNNHHHKIWLILLINRSLS